MSPNLLVSGRLGSVSFEIKEIPYGTLPNIKSVQLNDTSLHRKDIPHRTTKCRNPSSVIIGTIAQHP